MKKIMIVISVLFLIMVCLSCGKKEAVYKVEFIKIPVKYQPKNSWNTKLLEFKYELTRVDGSVESKTLYEDSFKELSFTGAEFQMSFGLEGYWYLSKNYHPNWNTDMHIKVYRNGKLLGDYKSDYDNIYGKYTLKSKQIGK